MKKIEHIGIAVKDLKKSEEVYQKIFNAAPYKREFVEEQMVETSFFRVGPNKIELLQSTSDEGPIAKYLDKYGEGMHHIAFSVEDIISELARLKAEGFALINEEPVKGADNKWVAFIHPKDTNKVLIELCQEIN